jgi:hypothetical protein
MHQLNDHLVDNCKKALILYWTEDERRWMRCCLAIIDPNNYVNLSVNELENYGLNELYMICNHYGQTKSIEDISVPAFYDPKLVKL